MGENMAMEQEGKERKSKIYGHHSRAPLNPHDL